MGLIKKGYYIVIFIFLIILGFTIGELLVVECSSLNSTNWQRERHSDMVHGLALVQDSGVLHGIFLDSQSN